nr:hypothetical protein [Tanacetum cinerariifolium]
RVEHLEYDKVSQALEITNLKRGVKKLEKGNIVKVLKLRRLKRVGTSQRIDTSDDTMMDDESNQGRIIDEMDKDDVVSLMDDKEEDKKDEEAMVVENDQVQGRQAKSQAEIYKIDMDHATKVLSMQGDEPAEEEDKKDEKDKVVENAQVQGRQAESQAKIYKIDMDHASKVLSMQEDEPAEVQEIVDIVTTAKLITEVITAASKIVTVASTIVFAAEPQVPIAAITAVPTKVAAAPSRRRKGVVIRDPEEESTTSSIILAEAKSKDKGKGILVEEPKPLKKKQQVKMDKEYSRKLHAELNKNIDWDVSIDHVKLKAKEHPVVQRYQIGLLRMSYDDIRPIFEAKFNSNVDFLLKTKEQMEEEESKALQRINETPAERAAKRKKLNEEGRIIAEMDKDDVVALMDDKEEDKKDEKDKVVENAQVQGRQAESQAKIYKIDMDH